MVGPSVSERYRSDGIGEVHGGRTPSHHLSDTMNGKASILLSGLVAILMVTCAVPFMASEDSDALIGNTTGMSLNTDSAVLYQTGGTSSIQLSIEQYIAGDNPSNATWTLNDLDDGTSFVQLSTNTGSSTTVSVNANATITDAMSVEVVATIGTHHASAVIVAYPSPSTTATVFHFYFKIDSEAIDYLLNDGQITSSTLDLPTLPEGYDIYNGFWVTVDNSVANLSTFNALTAIQWYFTQNGWSNHFGDYGWIEDLLGLGSYSGEEGVWYYWAQYHLTNEGWEFNNTTLEFITTVEESYIGMIFWGSPSAEDMPDSVDFPA